MSVREVERVVMRACVCACVFKPEREKVFVFVKRVVDGERGKNGGGCRCVCVRAWVSVCESFVCI